MDALKLLRELSLASGIPGYEHEARAVAQQAFSASADLLRTDALGNLIALKKGAPEDGAPRRSIMLAAHVDEIGLMITAIEDGFIRFTTVGGIDLRTIIGQEVVVHGTASVPGVIGCRPPHVLPAGATKKPVPLQELFVDTGIAADRLNEMIAVGDSITFRRDVLELAEGFVSGKAFDDRAGVVSLAACVDTLTHLRHAWDVYAVTTTQEEVGVRGAIVSAYGIAPDIAVAVDVGFGAQQGVGESESITMDGGPSIAMGPNIHPLIHARLLSTAKEYEIPHQVEVAAGNTGTDAWAIQVARQGIPTGLLSIPLRYMHTSVETVCLKDIERTGRLLALFIASLNEDLASKLGLPAHRAAEEE